MSVEGHLSMGVSHFRMSDDGDTDDFFVLNCSFKNVCFMTSLGRPWSPSLQSSRACFMSSIMRLHALKPGDFYREGRARMIKEAP